MNINVRGCTRMVGLHPVYRVHVLVTSSNLLHTGFNPKSSLTCMYRQMFISCVGITSLKAKLCIFKTTGITIDYTLELNPTH